MKELESLVTLIEKTEWASHVYKEAGDAYEASSQKFTHAAVHPRNRLWRSDTVILSLLKHCDAQGLTLQSIYEVCRIVSSELDQAIAKAHAHIQESALEKEKMKKAVQQEFLKVQKAVQKRGKALSGANDLWKADLDLKKAIREYVSQETEMLQLEQEEKQKHIQAYNTLYTSYCKTLNEYMISTVGHLNILAHNVDEYTYSTNSPVLQKEPCLETPPLLSGYSEMSSKNDLLDLKKSRFSELYGQALHENRGKDLSGALRTLSVRGCGLFSVPKISAHLVFLVCTSTDYLHAFSIQPILSKISTDLFIKNQEPSLKALHTALAQYNETEVEEINSYLLNQLGSLPVIEKIFPVSLKNMKISMHAGGRELYLTETGTVFFSKQIRIQAGNPQQMRKFFSLLQEDTSTLINNTNHSDEIGVPKEFVVAWSPATYENPW